MKNTAAIALWALVAFSSAANDGQTNAYVETVAGSAFVGHVDGVGTMTMFSAPKAIAVDASANLFVWDSGNLAIRKIDAARNVTTLASNLWVEIDNLAVGSSGLLMAGKLSSGQDKQLWRWNGGLELLRSFAIVGNDTHPVGLIQTPAGVFLSLQWRIYVLTNDTLAVFAGSGNRSRIDGQGIFSSFQRPISLAADRVGNIYVADGATVRKVSPDASVTTIASHTPTNFESIAVNQDGVVCWSTFYSIRRLVGRNVNVIGGVEGVLGFNDGESVSSLFRIPQGVAFGPDNRVYVADTANNRIRRITFDAIPASNLGIELRPTLTITGPIGGRFRIEARNNLDDSWAPITTVTLTNSPTLWTESDFPKNSKRFYRSVREQ